MSESNFTKQDYLFGLKHPKPNLSQPHTALQRFTLPFSTSFWTEDDPAHGISDQRCLLMPMFYGERNHFTENHALFDWLVKYFPRSTVVCKKKAQREPARVSSACSCRTYLNGVTVLGITVVQTNKL